MTVATKAGQEVYELADSDTSVLVRVGTQLQIGTDNGDRLGDRACVRFYSDRVQTLTISTGYTNAGEYKTMTDSIHEEFDGDYTYLHRIIDPDDLVAGDLGYHTWDEYAPPNWHTVVQ